MQQADDDRILLDPTEFALIWTEGRWGLHVPSEKYFKESYKKEMPPEALALTELMLKFTEDSNYVTTLARDFTNRSRS